jgi:hypothetical protein
MSGTFWSKSVRARYLSLVRVDHHAAAYLSFEDIWGENYEIAATDCAGFLHARV